MAEIEFIDISGEIREDARGTSFFPWQGRFRDPGELLQNFHLISILPGQTRGDHSHPAHVEWLYVFHGSGRFLWEEADLVRERRLAGHRLMVRIPPGIAHTLANPGPEVIWLLAWRERVRADPDQPETVPRPLSMTL